jgi:hypothetical protein
MPGGRSGIEVLACSLDQGSETRFVGSNLLPPRLEIRFIREEYTSTAVVVNLHIHIPQTSPASYSDTATTEGASLLGRRLPALIFRNSVPATSMAFFDGAGAE